MVNFEAIIPDFMLVLAICIVVAITVETLLYFRFKNGIIHKIGLPIILFALFCSLTTALATLALKTDQETFTLSLIIVIPSVLTFSVIFAYYLYRSIYKPIVSLVNITDSVANGNLIKFEISERSDELGKLEKSFSKMNENLRSIISQINSATEMLSSSTEELATSSEEVNASSEEISAITQRISQGAQNQNLKLNDLIKLSNTFKLTFEQKIAEINQTSSIIENISSQVNMSKHIRVSVLRIYGDLLNSMILLSTS